MEVPGARGKVLTLATVNPWVRGTRLPTLGPLLERATEIQRELAQGVQKPFQTVTWCHGEDAQAAGQRPLRFLRQVLAACAYPALLQAEAVPPDAGQRAQHILRELSGASAGAYNVEYAEEAVPRCVARWLERRDGGVTCDPRNIIPCGGTATAIMDVLSLVVDAEAAVPTGVLVPAPGPPLYAAAASLAGAVAVPYLLGEEGGWDLDVAELRRALGAARRRCRPKVLCVANPGDPTGHVLSRRRLRELLQLAADERLLLLADEAHQRSAGAFVSFKRALAEMGPAGAGAVQLVSFYSASKGFAAEAGLRAGFFELVNVDRALLRCFYTWGASVYPPVLGQALLAVLMEPPRPGDPSYAAFAAEKQAVLRARAHKAQLAHEILDRAPGLCCHLTRGSAATFPRLRIPPRAVREAEARGLEPDAFFCRELLEATGIVLAPGSVFGQRPGTHHVRLSLLPPAETLRMVLETVVDFHGAFLQAYA